MTRKRMLIGGGIAAVILASAWFVVQGQAIEVVVTTPTVQTVQEFIAEDGKTRLGEEYTMDMPISGTVERIAWKVGDVVQQGDVLVRVDSYELEQRARELEAQIAQRRAMITGVDVSKPKDEDIASAEIHVREMRDGLAIAERRLSEITINLEQAERDFDRAQSLFNQGVVSRSYFDDAQLRFRSLREQRQRALLELDNASKALRVAELAYERIRGSIDDNEYLREEFQAQIDGLKAQLALVRNDLEKTVVRAPVTGPILEKLVDDRRVLAAGTILLIMGDLESIEVEVDVLSEEITRVRVGGKAEISGKALDDRVIPGVLTRIYPAGFRKVSALGVEQQRVKTLVGFDNAEAGLRPGTTVDVHIITREAEDALAVPDRSVFRQRDRWSVFKLENGRAVLTPVTIGLRNDQWTQIVEGLGPDDVIVAEPKNELQDGARIRALN